MIELRGIVIDGTIDNHRCRLITRDPDGEAYKTIEYTGDYPLNPGRIRVFLSEQCNLEPGHIVWPKYIKIPEI